MISHHRHLETYSLELCKDRFTVGQLPLREVGEIEDLVHQLPMIRIQPYRVQRVFDDLEHILAPDDRWGVFPSIGAGWILSEESWMKGKSVDFLKLRASYGIVGRADFGVNLYKYYMGSGNSYYFKDTPASQSGMTEKQIAVDGLTYEKSHKLNVGMDFMV